MDIDQILKQAEARNTTLVYSVGKVTRRHVCNDSAVDITENTVEAADLRRARFDTSLRNTLRPCCWTTYGRMKS